MTWGLIAVAGTSLVGGLISSSSSSKAAKQAATTQAQAADESAQVQREALAQQQQQFDLSRQDTLSQYGQNREDILGQYNQNRTDILGQYNQSRDDTLGFYNTARSDLAPYREIGSNALLALSDQLGIARPSGMGDVNTGNPSFREDPGYKFAFDQGLKAVDARFPGMSRSGSKQKALIEYGQGVGDQQYGNWLSRLGTLATVGQTATGQSATLGANTAGTLAGSNPSSALLSASPTNALTAASPTNALNAIGANNSAAIGNYGVNAGNLLENAAAARASGYVGSANATNSAIGGGVNNLLSLYGSGAFSNLFGGSGQTSGPAFGWT